MEKLFEEARIALAKNSNPYPLIAITGKMGSGKDTIGGKLCSKVNGRAGIKYFFSHPLKEEVNDFIRSLHNPTESRFRYLLNTRGYRRIANERLSSEFNIELEDSYFIYDKLIGNFFERLTCLMTGDLSLNSYDRTPEVRRVLQYWGTEIRRKDDENYWVKIALTKIISLLNAGEVVFVTDARFTNEVEALRGAGGVIVRLEISQEEQARRIKERDGIQISEEAKAHSSETDLDNKEHLFDIIVNTDIFIDEVDSLIDHITEKMKGR